MMRTIGMLGGMSWESSAEYYRLANQLVKQRLGGLHSARCVLVSVDFAEVERLQVSGRWDEAGALLARAARSVEAAGAELMLLCTNTMHKVYDQVAAAVSIPVLHLADTTATAIQRAGIATVGLLGTGFTMEQDFYRDRLAGHGLTVLVPESDDRALVHRVIYDELCRGVVREESRQAYRDVMARLVARGAEGIVLGCTEIELLVGPDDSPVPTFPTTRLHVEAAVDQAISAPAPQITMRTRLDHCVIAVSDWDRSTAFYRDVMGARVVDHPDGRIAYRFGDQQLNVHGQGLDIGPLVARPPVVPGGSDLCFAWPGTGDELRAHLQQHHVEVETGPVRRNGGRGSGTSTYFRDPDGSLLEFIVYG
ncbi:MAG: amino acid racemase [Micromonosporaceae bacterium]